MTPRPYTMPDGRPAPSVMTADEAIEFLRIEGRDPKASLQRYRQESRIVGYRLGNHIRFRPEELMEFLTACER